MKRTVITTIAFAALLAVPTMAQQETVKKVWTLKDCVNYAIENNLEIKVQEQTCAGNELRLDNAKKAYLPSVGAQVYQGFDFGRGLTSNNTYANKNTRNTNFGVNAQVTLFEYGRAAQKRAAEFNLNAALADLENAKDNIGISVARAYLQVLYTKDMIEVSKKQLSFSELQLQQKESLIEQGKAPESEVFQAKSKVAQDQMSLVKAQNDYELALLDLSQVLELSSPEGLEVADPTVDMAEMTTTTPEMIYNEALVNRDDIKAAQYREQAAIEGITKAKAGHMPTLTASAGVGTNYYAIGGAHSPAFGDQLSDNMNKSVSLNLNIPIFSKFQTSNGIKSAKIEKISSTIAIDQAKKKLYKEIQQAYYNATSAKAQYDASVTAAESASESLEMQTKKFAAGRITQTEYNEALNSWARAESDMVQAKYSLAFAVKILDFYRGAEMQ